MAALSIHKALQDFWEGNLAFASKPANLWFDDVAMRGKAGEPVELPSAQLIDGGTTFEWEFEKHPEEVTNVSIVVRADSLEEAEAVMLGARFNGSAPPDVAGLDWSTGLDMLNADVKEVRPGRMTFGVDSTRGTTGKPVFFRRADYTITILRTG